MSPREHLRRLDELNTVRRLAHLNDDDMASVLAERPETHHRVSLVIDAQPDATWALVADTIEEALSLWESQREALPLMRLSSAFGLGLEHRLILAALADPRTDGNGIGSSPESQSLVEELADCGIVAVLEGGDRAPPTIGPELHRAIRSGQLGTAPESWRIVEPGPDELGRCRRRGGLDAATIEQVGRGQAPVVAVRGSSGSDRLDAVHALVGAHRLLLVPAEDVTPDLGAIAAASGSVAVLVADAFPGRAVTVPVVPGAPEPLIVLAAPDAALAVGDDRHVVPIEVPPATGADRRRLWTDLGHHAAPAALESMHLPLDHLRRVIASAGGIANAEGGDVTDGHFQTAGREMATGLLDGMADRIAPRGTLDDLVGPASMKDQLAVLAQWCGRRDRLAPFAGPGSESGGVLALFSGSSGTGKTLAAGLLGASLGKDVWRVDLAQMHDKYVGEAMKRTQRVLDQAEQLDVVLLLDEGDALLSRRTQVQSANDRWANADVNYLLQRLESYEGIVVVTTNLADNLDPAFERRFDLSVRFLEPGPDERERLFRLHLPPSLGLTDAELRTLAVEAELTGGQIRNACRQAAVRAHAVDSVTVDDLRAGVAEEYLKSGRRPPVAPATVGEARSGLDAFLETVW